MGGGQRLGGGPVIAHSHPPPHGSAPSGGDAWAQGPPVPARVPLNREGGGDLADLAPRVRHTPQHRGNAGESLTRLNRGACGQGPHHRDAGGPELHGQAGPRLPIVQRAQGPAGRLGAGQGGWGPRGIPASLRICVCAWCWAPMRALLGGPLDARSTPSHTRPHRVIHTWTRPLRDRLLPLLRMATR